MRFKVNSGLKLNIYRGSAKYTQVRKVVSLGFVQLSVVALSQMFIGNGL